jgi:hypothetical protein
MCESRGQFGSSDKPRVVPLGAVGDFKMDRFLAHCSHGFLPRRLLGGGQSDWPPAVADTGRPPQPCHMSIDSMQRNKSLCE